jgi:sugar phosphate isomerase/epimerase
VDAASPILVHLGSEIVPLGGGAAWAAAGSSNILTDDGVEELLRAIPVSGGLVAWSGWMGDGPGERDFRTWSAEGWARLEAACDRVVPSLAAHGVELLLRPHSAHVLSDVPSCLRFFRQREGQAVGLLLDPEAMLTPAMVGDAPDRLERILWALGPQEWTRAVVVSSAENSAANDDAIVHSPLGTGAIDAGVIAGLVRRLVPPELPRVLVGGDFERQAELLAAG